MRLRRLHEGIVPGRGYDSNIRSSVFECIKELDKAILSPREYSAGGLLDVIKVIEYDINEIVIEGEQERIDRAMLISAIENFKINQTDLKNLRNKIYEYINTHTKTV